MSLANTQLEFLDIVRERKRPPGGGQVMDGFFVYRAEAQRVDQVAYTLQCAVGHVYHLIQQGELPNACDISCDTAKRAYYRIPRTDVIDFLECRKEGAGNFLTAKPANERERE